MNRRPLSGALPETDLKGLRWSELRNWSRLIPGSGVRTAVERNRQNLRKQHAASD
jgi:hypothetical protein